MTKNQAKIVGWIYGLVGALLGGIATTLSAWLIAPGEFNLDPKGLPHMLQMLALSTMYHFATYVKQSPLPRLEWDEGSVTTTTTTTPTSTTTTTTPKP